LVALVLTTRSEARRQDALAKRRRRADEERLPIAREVQDVVGHSLAVINMQAGVALHLLVTRPQPGESLLSPTVARRVIDSLPRPRWDAVPSYKRGPGQAHRP
jgi:hypothetical protein